MLVAAQRLEQALASPSFLREAAWSQRITETLTELQNELRETRQTADAKGSLLDELVQDFPRLAPRAEQLREEYDALQQRVEHLRSAVTATPSATAADVEHVRNEFAELLASLRRVQSKETELIYEAYQVDIGVGD